MGCRSGVVCGEFYEEVDVIRKYRIDVLRYYCEVLECL